MQTLTHTRQEYTKEVMTPAQHQASPAAVEGLDEPKKRKSIANLFNSANKREKLQKKQNKDEKKLEISAPFGFTRVRPPLFAPSSPTNLLTYR